MTTNDVKDRLLAYLKGREDLDSLRLWLLPVSQEASKNGLEFETLVGSVGYLFARLAAGTMTEAEFLDQLRLLAALDSVVVARQSMTVGGAFCVWESSASTTLRVGTAVSLAQMTVSREKVFA
jgi:hypothetical protein